MSKALAKALERQTAAEENVDLILKKDYPPGRRVAWKRNGLYEGVVVQNGWRGRIKVNNSRTNREYWIEAVYIVWAQEQ